MKRISLIIVVLIIGQISVLAQGKNQIERIDSSVITANRIESSAMGRYSVTPEMTDKIVSAIGENDILQAISLRPGTAVGIEGSTGFFIRGSASGGNRIELSGAPIFRSSHLLGLVSALPSEMISTMNFAANGISASSGNMSSSLTEINLKKTIAGKFHASASVSPYMESVYAELPAGKSFTARVSARVSPALLIADKVIEKFGDKGESFRISEIGGKAYDLMSTIVWKPFDNVSIDAMAFSTDDGLHYSFSDGLQDISSQERVFKVGTDINLKQYGEINASYHYTSSKANHSERQNNGLRKTASSYGIQNRDKDSGVKLQYTIGIANILTINVGGEYTSKKLGYDTFRRLEQEEGGESGLSEDGSFSLISGFAGVSVGLPDIFIISASARPTSYKNGALKDNGTDLHGFVKVNPIKELGIEASYDKTYQYFHVLEGLPSGWSQDLMYACDRTFPKESLKQYCIGISGDFTIRNNGLKIGYSAGYFNRKMESLTSFKHTSHVFGLHDKIDKEEIVPGRGWSSGLEFYLEVRSKVFGASLSYTYSTSKRHFDALNNGKDFNFRFDKPHILNFAGDYLVKKSKKGKAKIEQRITAGVYLSSGNLMTVNQGFYPTFHPGVPVFIPDDRHMIEDMSELNNFRLPAYFRIDAGYTYSKSWDRYGFDLTISVFNLLNRHNAYQYFYSDDSWKQLSILPIMPTVKLKVSF